MKNIKVTLTPKSRLSEGLCTINSVVYCTIGAFLRLNQAIDPTSTDTKALSAFVDNSGDNYFTDAESGSIYFDIKTLKRFYDRTSTN